MALTFSIANYRSLSPMTKANIEALTEVYEKDGVLYTIDTIPCFSAADNSHKYRNYIYVDCSSCTEKRGKGNGKQGNCINVRKIKPQ